MEDRREATEKASNDSQGGQPGTSFSARTVSTGATEHEPPTHHGERSSAEPAKAPAEERGKAPVDDKVSTSKPETLTRPAAASEKPRSPLNPPRIEVDTRPPPKNDDGNDQVTRDPPPHKPLDTKEAPQKPEIGPQPPAVAKKPAPSEAGPLPASVPRDKPKDSEHDNNSVTAAPSSASAPPVNPDPAWVKARAPLTNLYSPYIVDSDTTLKDARLRLETAIAQTHVLRQAFTSRVYEKYRICLQPPPTVQALLQRIRSAPKSAFAHLEKARSSIAAQRQAEKRPTPQQQPDQAAAAPGAQAPSQEPAPPPLSSSVVAADSAGEYYSAGLHLVVLPEENVPSPTTAWPYADRGPKNSRTGQRVKSISAAAAAAAEALLDRVRQGPVAKDDRHRQRQMRCLATLPPVSSATKPPGRGTPATSGAGTKGAAASTTKPSPASKASASKSSTPKAATSATPSKPSAQSESWRRALARTTQRTYGTLSTNILLGLSPTADHISTASLPHTPAAASRQSPSRNNSRSSSVAALASCTPIAKTTQQRLQHPHPESQGGRRRQQKSGTSELPGMHMPSSQHPFSPAFLAMTLPPLPATKERLERKTLNVIQGICDHRAQNSVDKVVRQFVTKDNETRPVGKIELLQSLTQPASSGKDKAEAAERDSAGAGTTSESQLDPVVTLSVLQAIGLVVPGTQSTSKSKPPIILPDLDDSSPIWSDKLRRLHRRIKDQSQPGFTEAVATRLATPMKRKSVHLPDSKRPAKHRVGGAAPGKAIGMKFAEQDVAQSRFTMVAHPAGGMDDDGLDDDLLAESIPAKSIRGGGEVLRDADHVSGDEASSGPKPPGVAAPARPTGRFSAGINPANSNTGRQPSLTGQLPMQGIPAASRPQDFSGGRLQLGSSPSQRQPVSSKRNYSDPSLPLPGAGRKYSDPGGRSANLPAHSTSMPPIAPSAGAGPVPAGAAAAAAAALGQGHPLSALHLANHLRGMQQQHRGGDLSDYMGAVNASRQQHHHRHAQQPTGAAYDLSSLIQGHSPGTLRSVPPPTALRPPPQPNAMRTTQQPNTLRPTQSPATLAHGQPQAPLIQSRSPSSLLQGQSPTSMMQGQSPSLMQGQASSPMLQGTAASALMQGQASAGLIQGRALMQGQAASSLLQSQGQTPLMQSQNQQALIQAQGQQALMQAQGQQALMQGPGQRTLLQSHSQRALGQGQQPFRQGQGQGSLLPNQGQQAVMQCQSRDSLAAIGLVQHQQPGQSGIVGYNAAADRAAAARALSYAASRDQQAAAALLGSAAAAAAAASPYAPGASSPYAHAAVAAAAAQYPHHRHRAGASAVSTLLGHAPNTQQAQLGRSAYAPGSGNAASTPHTMSQVSMNYRAPGAPPANSAQVKSSPNHVPAVHRPVDNHSGRKSVVEGKPRPSDAGDAKLSHPKAGSPPEQKNRYRKLDVAPGKSKQAGLPTTAAQAAPAASGKPAKLPTEEQTDHPDVARTAKAEPKAAINPAQKSQSNDRVPDSQVRKLLPAAAFPHGKPVAKSQPLSSSQERSEPEKKKQKRDAPGVDKPAATAASASSNNEAVAAATSTTHKPGLQYVEPKASPALLAPYAAMIAKGRFHDVINGASSIAARLAALDHLNSVASCIPIPKALVLLPLKDRLNTPGFKTGNISAANIPRDLIGAAILVWLWTHHEQTFQVAFEKSGRLDVDPDCKWLIQVAIEASVRALGADIAESFARGEGPFAEAAGQKKSSGLGNKGSPSGSQGDDYDRNRASKKVELHAVTLVSKALMSELSVDRTINAVLPRFQSLVEYLDEARLCALRARSQERAMLATLISRKVTMSEAFSHAYASSVVRAGEALGHEQLFELVQEGDGSVSSMMPYDFFTGEHEWEDPCRPTNSFTPGLSGDELIRRAHARAMVHKSLRKMQERHNIRGGASTHGPYVEPVAKGSGITGATASPRPSLKRKGSVMIDPKAAAGTGSAKAKSWAAYDPSHVSVPLDWEPSHVENTPYGLHRLGERNRSLSLSISSRTGEPRSIKKTKRSLSMVAPSMASVEKTVQGEKVPKSTREIEWGDVAGIFQRVELPKKASQSRSSSGPRKGPKTIFAPYCSKIESDPFYDDESETEEDLTDDTVLSRHQFVLDDMKEKLSAILEARKKQQEKRKSKSNK